MAIEEIIKPNMDLEEFTPTTRFVYWTQLVSELDILTGTGSPEGVIEAKQKRLYMDEAGSTGNILYIKRDADIGGDRSQGWVLV